VRRAGAAVLALALTAGCDNVVPADEDPAVQLVFPAWSNQQRLPTSSHLRAVRFLSETAGYVAGEDTSIFRTADGGSTWTQLEHSPPSRGGDIAAMDVFKEGAAVHVGTAGRDAVSGGRWWTSGDGLNFTTPDADSTGFAEMTAVDLVAPGTAYYLARDGMVRAVTPSSVTTFSVGAAGTWLALAFGDTAGTGYAAGGGGAVRKTSTNGASWTSMVSGTSETLRDLCRLSGTLVFACGDAGTVIKTVNGTDWTGVPVGAAVTLRGVHFMDALTGWVVGDGGFIRRTADGGASWVAPSAAATSRDLDDVWFVNAAVGYAAGDYGTVIRTTDGGDHWTEISGGSLATLNAVDFTGDGVKGFAVGPGGFILRTLDGGARWEAAPSGVMADLLSVSVPDNGSGNVAYACGAGGTILKTSNSGATWSAMASGTSATLRAILFPSTDAVGFCAGDASTILHTSGGPWTSQSAPVAADYYSLAAPFTGMSAYAGGTGGTVIYTDMLGAVWYARSIGVSTTVRSLQSPSGSVVIAAGADGKVYRSLLSGQAGSWETLTPPAAPNGLFFSTMLSGGIAGDGIFLTDDGGASWTRSAEHTRWTLCALWMGAHGTGFAVGDQGTILKTLTGGW
jgi:photosystem II stability/assembly factor-like uncharacterized protein